MLDDNVLASIVDAAALQPGDLVLEIGPGAVLCSADMKYCCCPGMGSGLCPGTASQLVEHCTAVLLYCLDDLASPGTCRSRAGVLELLLVWLLLPPLLLLLAAAAHWSRNGGRSGWGAFLPCTPACKSPCLPLPFPCTRSLLFVRVQARAISRDTCWLRAHW
jgi:hypothetical protein